MSNLDLRWIEQQFGPFVHMAPLDKAIWSRYLVQGGAQFAPYAYDVRVGDGVDMGPNASAMDRAAAYALTTKRIDAVAIVNGRPRIIEVKQRAGLGAIGQLKGYGLLYKQQFPSQPNPELFLVTDYLQPDMLPILNSEGINVIEVGL